MLISRAAFSSWRAVTFCPSSDTDQYRVDLPGNASVRSLFVVESVVNQTDFVVVRLDTDIHRDAFGACFANSIAM